MRPPRAAGERGGGERERLAASSCRCGVFARFALQNVGDRFAIANSGDHV
jgi:hypothetical protein